MHNCAIICEYNPFHTGHMYQLERAHENGASNVFCVMSGNFVQSAMPAFCDKSIRAECAVRGGANAVIELPTMYATASAGHFAEGAVKIISQIKDISHIVMGATSPADTIFKIAEIKIKHAEEFENLRKKHLKNGKSYKIACISALNELYGKIYSDNVDITSVIQEPNNMLCAEYIAAIDKYAANIEPLIIKRRGAVHGSAETDCDFVSATAIRQAFDNDYSNNVAKYVPYLFDKIKHFREHHAPHMGYYNAIAYYSLKCESAESLAALRDCADGMEHLITSIGAKSYADIVNHNKLKKYGIRKIERLLLDSMLTIKTEYLSYPFVTRLLACRDNFDYKLLPSIVKTNNADIKQAAKNNPMTNEIICLEERAAALYGTITGSGDGYFNYSLVKV